MRNPTKDFNVYEEMTARGKTIWRVRTGGRSGRVRTCCNTEKAATEMADQLNADPWFLDRGNTRADRLKGYN